MGIILTANYLLDSLGSMRPEVWLTTNILKGAMDFTHTHPPVPWTRLAS